MKVITKFNLSMLLVGLARFAFSQSFSVATNYALVEPGVYNYSFAIAYDQIGDNQQLTSDIWDWGFSLADGASMPSSVQTPTGWKWAYDDSTSSFSFYTEGDSGWYAGDFGSFTLQPHSVLSGFSLSGPYEPTTGLTSAIDTDFNSDISIATIPGAAVNPVPEPPVFPALVIGLLATLGRRKKSLNRRTIMKFN